MAKIRQLSSLIVAQIAAGEVIERPAFAVKELIENAIDSGATDIQILIEQAGLKKIQVMDNGEGMDQQDLQESVKPHTTSKLIDESLSAIKTLGFRGEALASLSAVADIVIKSRIATEPTGNEIIVREGKIEKIVSVGMPVGTVITATNLFGNIPARKKFLKSQQTEARLIIAVATHLAASYPTIRFRLIHNKKTIFDIPPEKEKIERIKRLVGEDTFAFFIPVKSEESYISISGFIAKPQLNSTTSSKQFLFVNNRKVIDKSIALAVKESYGTMLESSAYPIFVLFLDIPHQLVDINVHPRKEQVSFAHTLEVFNAVKTAVMQTLQDNNLTFQNLSWKRSGVGTTTSQAAQLLRKNVLEKEMLTIEPQAPLIQFHRTYIAMQTKNGFVLIDQHAAHERVLFEKLQQEFAKQLKIQKTVRLENQRLINLSKSELLLLFEHKKVFTKLGIRFSGNKNIKVTQVPQFFTDRDPRMLIKNILEYLEQDLPLPKIDKISEEMIAFLACRSAIKSGDIINDIQMKEIITQLESTPHNATCPHGRPTRIVYSLDELNRHFKR